MARPDISVVMGVYNSASTLQGTLDSVLSQDIDLEFIVVDDGSTDATSVILGDRAATDGRLQLIRQENLGLTAALVRGCAVAKGEFIARQDAGGDVSLPGRFRSQLAEILCESGSVLNSCGTRFSVSRGEFLFDRVVSTEQLRNGLEAMSLPHIQGPSSHPAAMFRRSAYERVGGNRRSFTVAQDVDLCLRLAEVGTVCAVDDVLYPTIYTLQGLSGRLQAAQLKYTRAAVAGARRRRKGLAEGTLPQPMAPAERSRTSASRSERAAFHYFLAASVAGRDVALARRHFRQAVVSQPCSLRSWVRWLIPRLRRVG